MLTIAWIFIGFLAGVIATVLAWSFSSKAVRNPETTRLTALWSLKDVMEPGVRPAVIAESVSGVQFPPGSKLVVPRGQISAVPPEILATCEVRMHPDVRINAVFGKDRALVFSGHVSPKAFAVFTMDAHAVQLLQADFQRMWRESDPYVEVINTISELSGKDGRVVDVSGKAIEILEFRGRKMLRLTDGKVNVGVVTRQQDVAQFQGRDIRVVGRMHREQGYAFLEADKLSLVATN